MTSAAQRVGRYELLSKLGAGSMGVVYRARADDQDVALKTVTMEGEVELAALRREITALARLHHPGVARILDHGVHDGLPWYAMELVEGESFGAAAGWLAGSGAASIPGTWGGGLPSAHATTASVLPAPERLQPIAGGQLPAAISLVRALCEPLAFLHGEGVVHRDLKPGNILVIDGIRPVIVDFGLVGRFSAGRRERLREDQIRGGTVMYMAPEQIEGHAVDARADLYAVGCLLYELLTGRPPFVSDSQAAVLWRHLTEEPTPLRERVAGVPDGLQELVSGLLQKDPSKRIAYADLVAARLEDLGASPPAEVRRNRPYLYSGRFAGREAELGRIQAMLQDHGVAILGAESGGGKTRVALELARSLKPTHRVEVAECVPMGTERGSRAHGGSLYPFQPLFHQVADRIRAGGEALPPELVGPLLPFLPGLTEGGPAKPGAARPVLRALTGLLAGSAQGPPTLVLVDDLQWADELTLEWVATVARTRPSGLKLLCTYRVDEVDAVLADVLQDCGRAVHLLPTLDEAAVGSMVRDMLALDTAPQTFVRFLLGASRGNPFFVAEYLRTAIAEGVLLRDERGRWHVLAENDEEARPEHFEAMALPDSLQAIVARRLSGLSDRARRLAGLAAALGRETELSLLNEAGGAIDEPLAELISRGVLTVEEDRARFLHDKLREAAYAEIPRRDRARVHAQAAEALLACSPARDPAVVAFHLEHAGRASQARQAYLQAAARADADHAPRDAVLLYEAALRQATVDNPESVEARVRWARAARISGDSATALRVIEKAVGQAMDAGLLALASQALRELSLVHTAGGSLGDAREAADRAVELGPGHRDPIETGRAQLALADSQRNQGDLDGAAAIYDRLEAQSDPELSRARILGVARVRFEQGRAEEALQAYDEALALESRAGSLLGEASAINGRANALASLGRIDEALAAYELSLSRNRRAGNAQGEGVALANMAIQYAAIGEPAEADRRHAEALALFREVSAKRFAGHSLTMMAGYARAMGKPALARERALEAAALLEQVGDRVWLERVMEELALLEGA